MSKIELKMNVELGTGSDKEEVKIVSEDAKRVKNGDKCEGKGCKRYWNENLKRFLFKAICNVPEEKEMKSDEKRVEFPLKETSFLDPIEAHAWEHGYCGVCKPDQGLNKTAYEICKTKKSCCQNFWELDDLADFCEDTGHKKFNPIWTGEDPNQIGVFVRNMKIEAVNEEEQTISVHLILNLVWLDEDLCEYVKGIEFPKKRDWFVQMNKDDYIKYFEQVRNKRKDVREPEIPVTTQEKWHNPLPNVKIWNASKVNGYEIREEVISLNKKHIGKNTVYWRRIMRAKLNCEYTSKSFPFGWETFKMSIRLMSRTDQHLVLLRTAIWWKAHNDQCQNPILADHTFAYIHPNNKGLKDWKVCSVHQNKDRFYSKFDNNDLSFRLPVRVSDGKDTQSRFEALIILKRRPGYIMWNIWLYFTLTSVLALLTYNINPTEDLPDRLAIAVAIIFVQMGLKWDSSRKTPRVKYVTALDVHMFLSIALVVCEAILQVVIAASYSGNSLSQADNVLLGVNIGCVVVVNIGTAVAAKIRQYYKRKSLQEILVNFTGFNQHPIGDYQNGQIGRMFILKGWKVNQRLQISTSELEASEGKERNDEDDNSCCLRIRRRVTC